jgi:hypothetical protein
MPNENNLKPFKKGYDERRNLQGRKPKFITLLKNDGYSVSEVNDTIKVMMAMTLTQLHDVFKNPDATILEKTIANALRKSYEKGSLYTLDTLWTRLFGKPKETSAVTTDGKIEFIVTKGKTIL